MADPWDDVRFWLQVIGDARRTILCPPELEFRVKTLVDTLGVGGIYDVVASPMVPDDSIYIADTGAMEASTAEALQHGLRWWSHG